MSHVGGGVGTPTQPENLRFAYKVFGDKNLVESPSERLYPATEDEGRGRVPQPRLVELRESSQGRGGRVEQTISFRDTLEELGLQN